MKHLVQIVSVCMFFFVGSSAIAQESICYGTTGNGRLEYGVKLPGRGKNFVSYGVLPELAGRTYVHSKVKNVIVEAYRMLEGEQPGKVYKYGETGLEEGGKFKPHKTHQNGLSVDFMVPVMNAEGKSVHLPTTPFNRYGYSIEFDDKGSYDSYKIDYESLGAHIVMLHKTAGKYGVGIRRVIFDPLLQPYLLKTKYGEYIKKYIKIPDKRSWVRHDEHYHVDFIVECESM